MTGPGRRWLSVVLAGVAAAAISACGSKGPETVSVPKVAPAQTFALASFTPSGSIRAGHPVTLSFRIAQPGGGTLTRYRTGSGPHTGVHLIIVRDDLHYIIHDHPPIAANGVLRQRVTFPAPGPYRVLVDAYPNVSGQPPNFQLYRRVTVSGGPYRPAALPPFHPVDVVDGYRFVMQGAGKGANGPHLKAIQAQFVHVTVTDPRGRPVHFTPWFGALAHAIFFRVGSLDYFHTHVCAPSAPNCGSLAGVAASRVSGRATAPGKITLGVLLPLPGTWRVFLQMQQHGRVITAPFTLHVT